MLGFLKSIKRSSEDKTTTPAEDKPAGWLARLKSGLSKTREKLGSQIGQLLGRHTRIDDELYEELESILIGCDIGVGPTEHGQTASPPARPTCPHPHGCRGG